MKYVHRFLKIIKTLFWFISAMYIIGIPFALFPKVVILTDELLVTINERVAEDFFGTFSIWFGKIFLNMAPLWFLIFGLVIATLLLIKVINKNTTKKVHLLNIQQK